MAPSGSASASANVTYGQPHTRLVKHSTTAGPSVSFAQPATGKRPIGRNVSARPSISFEQPPGRRPLSQHKHHQSLPVYPEYPTHAVELDSKEIGRAFSTSIPPTTWTLSPQPIEQGKLRPQPPPKETDGLYGVCISERLDNGTTIPLEPSGGRAWVVSAVLDLSLRMLESPRGREALDNLAQKSLCVWRERPVSHHADEIVPKAFNATTAVDEFLYTVRHNLPLIKLDPRRNGFLADPSTTSLFAYYRSPSLSQLNLPRRFNPKAAAVLHLNSTLITKLYHARLKSDICRRHKRSDEALVQTQRFRRLGFHIAAMVTHHLCHLFVNFLRDYAQEGELRDRVTDGDFMRLVTRYDPGAEWEVDFFGGRVKLFVDFDEEEGGGKGESYVIKRGGNGRRMAARVAEYKVESYLGGGKSSTMRMEGRRTDTIMAIDFSVPLLTEVEGEVFPLEKYQDVKRRYGNSKLTDCHHGGQGSSKSSSKENSPSVGSEAETLRGSEKAPEIGSRMAAAVVDQPLGLPWNIQGQEYQLLKQTCLDPAVRVVSPMRVRTMM
ncbi:hypothetical protein QBC36DRAFT_306970 [Triangularia setosa]|uniref:Uncharacterized protein n=1 Tax=Triangularia setosa TaxID=2587417 RepID=A0AAN6WGJ1_9PEZI|nr:hypothetical protein QBC36DRAFT_306970 [Podospora setosa]